MTPAVRERPINFSAPMIGAILDDKGASGFVPSEPKRAREGRDARAHRSTRKVSGERPVIFSGPMITAILARRKTTMAAFGHQEQP